MDEQPVKPTAEQVRAAVNATLPDVIGPGLGVLFCGINPGLYTAAVGHHFARPGNRFWPALFAGGFTPRQVRPWEEQELLGWGMGITNLVARATAAAAELTPAEFAGGAELLRQKVERYQPRHVAFLGIGAYRLAFGDPAATLGRQARTLGPASVWVLPNPSGLNAHYQARDLARLFGELRAAAKLPLPAT